MRKEFGEFLFQFMEYFLSITLIILQSVLTLDHAFFSLEMQNEFILINREMMCACISDCNTTMTIKSVNSINILPSGNTGAF